MKEKIKKLAALFQKFLKEFLSIAARPEMRILPGNIAFFLVLSFAPILTLIAMLASSFSISIMSFLHDFRHIIPNDILQLLQMFLTDDVPYTGTTLIFLLTGFIAASNGAHSIIIASNTLYNIKDDHVLKRRIKSFFLTIVLILEFIFILVFLVFGNILMKAILSFGLFDGIRDYIFGSFVFLKWPIMILVSYLLIKLLYTFAPDRQIGSKKVTRGSLFTTAGFMIITAIYSYYANNLANYSVFYGSLSNLIVLMVWIYSLSYILVMGIAINVSYYSHE
jgi:membrane protein